ncbi:MAG: dienelactone hydrolase family protein [Cytophagaceae bacterium]|nr:dienelactone hydrolase family protein [Gemmatimonadaceae bacterium]
MVHGRGATAESIAGLGASLNLSDALVLAPQASGNTWYPQSFLMPMAVNEPGITSGIALIESLVRQVEEQGIPSERIALLGFSQGACLTLEFSARHPRRYGAVIGFSGGLIGPPGTPRTYPGSLDGTPIFLGCSDIDGHIPKERVQETAEVLTGMGASVDMRLYPGMGHLVNEDELSAARALLDAL